MDDTITIRQAVLTDVPDLVRLRRRMFEAMGVGEEKDLDASDAACADYFNCALPAGKFHGWLAVTPDGFAVASGGVVVDEHPPGPGNLSGQVGYVMSLFTESHYRRHGIARRLMNVMVQWLAEQGIQRITLHSTQAGRPLYQNLGFVDSNEMRLDLRSGE